MFILWYMCFPAGNIQPGLLQLIACKVVAVELCLQSFMGSGILRRFSSTCQRASRPDLINLIAKHSLTGRMSFVKQTIDHGCRLCLWLLFVQARRPTPPLSLAPLAAPPCQAVLLLT